MPREPARHRGAAGGSRPRALAGGPGTGERTRWVLLVYRIPREPSRHRVAVWRKLRDLGALYLRDGVAALPEDAVTREQMEWLQLRVPEAGGGGDRWGAGRRAPARAGRWSGYSSASGRPAARPPCGRRGPGRWPRRGSWWVPSAPRARRRTGRSSPGPSGSAGWGGWGGAGAREGGLGGASRAARGEAYGELIAGAERVRRMAEMGGGAALSEPLGKLERAFRAERRRDDFRSPLRTAAPDARR